MSDAPAYVWLTVCDGCRQWVPGIFHTTFDGKRLCRDCAPPDEKLSVRPYPLAPQGSLCACGAAAPAECEGCGEAFCEPCWNHHSHTTTFPDIAAAATQRPPLPPLDGAAAVRLVEFDERWRYLWMGVAKWRPLADDEPCPVCRSVGSCAAGPDGRIFCINVESTAGARDRDNRRGWIHHAKRQRRKGVAA